MFKTKEEAEKEVKARDEELLKAWCPMSQLDCVRRCVNFSGARTWELSDNSGYYVTEGKCRYFNT